MSGLVQLPWAITPEKVEIVVRRLAAAARPRKIILFGSYARGQIHADSDLDLLVITEDDVKSPRVESARLRRMLRDVSMPMDILVIGQGRLEEMQHRADLIYQEACETGKVVYERAEAS